MDLGQVDDMRRIRKRFRVLLLAAFVVTIVVPVGFALTVRPEPLAMRARTDGSHADTSLPLPAAVLLVTTGADGSIPEDLPDALRLFFMGAILFGLAAVVRKAV
jgi:hypothetical protein